MAKEITILEAIRVLPEGNLVVVSRQERYGQFDEITDPQVEKAVLVTIGDLIKFAGGYEALVKRGIVPPPSSNGGNAAPPKKPRPISSLMAAVARKTGAAPATPSPSQPASHVKQVDVLLQKHLRRDGTLSERSIHLVPGGSSGIQINVDGLLFDAPQDVADKRIRLAIKKALREWQAA